MVRLDHHGDKLVRRFDANSYLIIGKAMDMHDVGRGRSGLAAAMRRIVSPTMVMGITTDILYPEYQQRFILTAVAENGTPTEYVQIDSPHGHDAFLINFEQVGPPLRRFLDDVSRAR
jgi:homoserine O-acetyltransferase